MTSIDGTPGTPPEPSSNRLAWATLVTGLVSIVAVVILALTHNAEAIAPVGAIGVAVTSGVQINSRNRQ
ncbi:hypothetical protein ABZT43_30925 [Streptomyces sp. NPDC005349]|uniref:hypothetical protein n=1 Tax=Streptomyces sp. NPDC005349 TaxID=3157037 RepID=UPI0033AC133A